MTTFVIVTDHNLTAFATPEETQDLVALGGQAFTSEKELGQLAAAWPGSRLVEIWNSFAGVTPFTDLKPVTKFENRQKAVRRIWQAVQKLAPGAQGGAQGGPGAAASTPGDHPGQESRQARPGREEGQGPEAACRPRRQQEGRSPRLDAPAPGRHTHGDHGCHRLAAPQRAGLRQRHPGKENGADGRVHQERGR